MLKKIQNNDLCELLAYSEFVLITRQDEQCRIISNVENEKDAINLLMGAIKIIEYRSNLSNDSETIH
jgi:hypothetical protein